MRAFSNRALTFTSLSIIRSSRMWVETDAKGETTKADSKGPETPTVDTTKLEADLAKAKEEIADLKKDVLYRAADAENARRIGREDVEKAKLYGITSFGKDILEVADTLEKAIQAVSKIPEEELQSNKNLNSILTGVKLSVKVLHKNMSKHGIEKVAVAVGDKFDPNVHEALARVPVSEKYVNDSIVEVLKEGYKIKGRILRAAQVAVAAEP